MCKKSSYIFDIRTSAGSYFPKHEKRVSSKIPNATYIEDQKIPDIKVINEIDIVVEEELVFKSLQKDNSQEQMLCNKCYTLSIKILDKILQCKSCGNIQLATQEKQLSNCLVVEKHTKLC